MAKPNKRIQLGHKETLIDRETAINFLSNQMNYIAPSNTRQGLDRSMVDILQEAEKSTDSVAAFANDTATAFVDKLEDLGFKEYTLEGLTAVNKETFLKTLTTEESLDTFSETFRVYDAVRLGKELNVDETHLYAHAMTARYPRTWVDKVAENPLVDAGSNMYKGVELDTHIPQTLGVTSYKEIKHGSIRVDNQKLKDILPDLEKENEDSPYKLSPRNKPVNETVNETVNEKNQLDYDDLTEYSQDLDLDDLLDKIETPAQMQQ